jgi:hypothetical protein
VEGRGGGILFLKKISKSEFEISGYLRLHGLREDTPTKKTRQKRASKSCENAQKIIFQKNFARKDSTIDEKKFIRKALERRARVNDPVAYRAALFRGRVNWMTQPSKGRFLVETGYKLQEAAGGGGAGLHRTMSNGTAIWNGTGELWNGSFDVSNNTYESSYPSGGSDPTPAWKSALVLTGAHCETAH